MPSCVVEAALLIADQLTARRPYAHSVAGYTVDQIGGRLVDPQKISEGWWVSSVQSNGSHLLIVRIDNRDPGAVRAG